MQHKLLPEFLDVIPKQKHVPSQDKGRQRFSFCLEIKTYTLILEYLIKIKAIDKFQWCLDNMESELIDSQTLVKSMQRAITRKEKIFQQRKAEGLETSDTFKKSIIESDVLHRLYKLEKKYEDAFQILVDMQSTKAFGFFEGNYQGFKLDESLLKNLMKLIDIDCQKLVYYLLNTKNSFEQQKVYVDYCVQ